MICYICVCSGAYVFEIHVLEVSCQCGVEFWISSSMHPKEMKRIVSFEHGQALVSTYARELNTRCYNHSYCFQHFSNLAVSSEPVMYVIVLYRGYCYICALRKIILK